MTVANSKRATSTPFAAPNMSYTPASSASAARKSLENMMRADTRQKHKDDIDRCLKNDLTSMSNARRKAKSSIAWNLLTEQ